MGSSVFTPGATFGFFTLLGRIRPNSKLSANLKVRWRVRCVCGKEEILPQYYMTRETPKTHCGCKHKSNKTIHNDTYRIWLMMHQRCYNEEHMAYKHYGGRGIGICLDWNRLTNPDPDKAFENFLAYVKPRPSKDYSIDRIDVDKGYEPGNVRWATAKEQRANQRPRSKVHAKP